MPALDLHRLQTLLDEIIPENEETAAPSGGGQDVVEYVLNEIGPKTAAWAKLLAEFDDFGVTQANGAAFLHQLEEREPALFLLLKRATYIGYYGRPQARTLFGLSAEPTQPRGYDVPDEPSDLLADLTAPVVARGRCFRPVSSKDISHEK